MPITPEDRARQNIDKLLMDAGWIVQDKKAANLAAGRGVAVVVLPLKTRGRVIPCHPAKNSGLALPGLDGGCSNGGKFRG